MAMNNTQAVDTKKEAPQESQVPAKRSAEPMGLTQTYSTFEGLWRASTAIAKSRLFGIDDPHQVMGLMLVAQAQGIHPALVAQDYDIIKGKAAKGAQAMLRDFLKAGGKVVWEERSETRAAARFSHPDGGTVDVEWTIDMAKRAGLANKDNWKNYPRPMLHARTVSEGVRAVYPGATGGMYTPEEAGDMELTAEVIDAPEAATELADSVEDQLAAAVAKAETEEPVEGGEKTAPKGGSEEPADAAPSPKQAVLDAEKLAGIDADQGKAVRREYFGINDDRGMTDEKWAELAEKIDQYVDACNAAAEPEQQELGSE